LLLCQYELTLECGVDGPSQLSLEATERLSPALALSVLVLEVGTCRCVDAALGNRDPVLLAAAKPAAEPLEPEAAVERAQRHQETRIELVQLPAQALLGPATRPARRIPLVASCL
jgi:hypothetical protein